VCVCMPSVRVLVAPLLGLLLAARLAPLLDRPPLTVDSSLSPSQLRETLSAARLAHVGGQHRGGTTLLLRGIASHNAVSLHSLHAAAALAIESEGAPPQPQLAAQRAATLEAKLHNEGIFLQDVYPKSGLDHQPQFFLRRRVSRLVCAISPSLEGWIERTLPASLAYKLVPWLSCRLKEGIGGYAFSRASRLDAQHPLANEAGALRLFSQWEPHWNTSKPWLVEKSPSNARAIGMLSAMWAAARVKEVRFIFISRHPIAQALAMRVFIEPDDAVLEHQIQHWLAVEEAIREDSLRYLRSVALLSLEGLAAAPLQVVSKLLAWMGLCTDMSELGGETADWAQSVQTSPNAKYAAFYKERFENDAHARAEHTAIVRAYGAQVQTVSGYLLHSPPEEFVQPPQRDTQWTREWVGDHKSDLVVTVI